MELESFYRGKTVLITGHTGFKGAWLTQWLISLGAKVIGLSNYEKTGPSLYDLLNLKSEVIDIRGDIRDYSTFLNVISKCKPEIVFHLAAQSLVLQSYEMPLATIETNVLGTACVLEAIRMSPGVRVAVIVTSDKCYQNLEQEHFLVESDPLGGQDIYSASKACAELVTKAYVNSFLQPSQSKEQCKVFTVRSGNVIGGGDWAAHRLIPDCIRSWSVGENALIRNPQSKRPWIHVLDSLSGYLRLAPFACRNENLQSGESFNFAPLPQDDMEVEDLVKEMSKYWPDAKFTFALLSQKEALQSYEAKILKLSSDKAQNILSWKPKLNTRTGIAMTAQWYRDFYSNKQDAKKLTLDQIESYFRFI